MNVERKQYTTDLQEQEWLILVAFMDRIMKQQLPGRPPEHSLREIINAIRYLLRNGVTWRNLPGDFPPWQSVYYYFNKWRQQGLWQKLNKHLRRRLRRFYGRKAQPSAGVVDSQSVKGSVHAGNGYDGGKKVNGRRRHVLVDTLGLLLAVVVTPANVSDQRGLRRLLEQVHADLPRLRHLWVDQGYRGVDFLAAILETFLVVVEVVKPPEGKQGFQLQARRKVVERSLAWYGNYRRLARDYEVLAQTSECLIYLASCDVMLKRLAGTSTPKFKVKSF